MSGHFILKNKCLDILSLKINKISEQKDSCLRWHEKHTADKFLECPDNLISLLLNTVGFIKQE